MRLCSRLAAPQKGTQVTGCRDTAGKELTLSSFVCRWVHVQEISSAKSVCSRTIFIVFVCLVTLQLVSCECKFGFIHSTFVHQFPRAAYYHGNGCVTLHAGVEIRSWNHPKSGTSLELRPLTGRIPPWLLVFLVEIRKHSDTAVSISYYSPHTYTWWSRP